MSVQDAGPFIKLYKDQIASLSAQLVEAKAEKTTLQEKVETVTQDLLDYKGSHLIIEAEVASLKAQKIAGARVSARKRGTGGGNSYKKVKPVGFERELSIVGVIVLVVIVSLIELLLLLLIQPLRVIYLLGR